MPNRGKTARLLLATSAAAVAVGVQASETTTYQYDALGRLVAVTSSGTVNNGIATSIGYDPAGNRSGYTVSGAAGASPPPPPPGPVPPPPPPPPSGNAGPVANSDSLAVARCGWGSKNVTANDTDSEGNYPLSLVSVSGGGKGTATVSDANHIEFQSNGITGATTWYYVVKDSLGAQSTGALTINISTTGTCA
jgi:hypothetical protein